MSGLTWDDLIRGGCPSTYNGAKCTIPLSHHVEDEGFVRHKGGGLTWDRGIHEPLVEERDRPSSWD